MTTEHPASAPRSRRSVLRAGAVGASVVWAAPAIRSAGIDDRFIGSPGLATTTTDPQPTIVMFAGSFSAAGAATNPPECAVRQVATSGSFNLGDIGNGTVSFDACLNAVFNVIGGTFTITTAAGTMSGTLDSGSVTLMAQPPLPFEFFGTITGGTDGFLGASGSIVLDGNINDFPGTSVSGSITGTATIP